MLLCMQAFSQRTDYNREDSLFIVRALQEAPEKIGKQQPMLYFGKLFLGRPYVGHTLEKGSSEHLIVNTRELDCTTFVETLYALARTTLQGRQSWRDYAANLESLRYRGGVMGDYSTRLHYISLWIIDNFSRGNLVEVTPDLPHATTMVKTINFMSAHADSYQSLKGDSAMVVKIKRMEDGLRNHQMPYLKKMWLNKDDVRQALHAGDFVGLVTRIDGLDISHLGIIEKDENGEIYLLDASMSGGKVMIESEPLGRWLKSGKNTLGIRVFRLK